jgi:hypothetical protein
MFQIAVRISPLVAEGFQERQHFQVIRHQLLVRKEPENVQVASE